MSYKREVKGWIYRLRTRSKKVDRGRDGRKDRLHERERERWPLCVAGLAERKK